MASVLEFEEKHREADVRQDRARVHRSLPDHNPRGTIDAFVLQLRQGQQGGIAVLSILRYAARGGRCTQDPDPADAAPQEIKLRDRRGPDLQLLRDAERAGDEIL